MNAAAPNPGKPDAYERFTALLVASQPTIMGFIRSLLPQSDVAEDVLQRTCLVAWQKFDQFDETTKFSTWACRIAYLEVKNVLRTRQRDRHVFSDAVMQALAHEAASDSDRLADERRALEQCMQVLSGDERELLRQCYAQGAKVTDLATQLNRSANSLYKQLNRVRRRLLACITRRLQEGGAA